MNRIAVEQVREAYRITGRKPGRGKNFDGDSACGLGVCFEAAAGPAFEALGGTRPNAYAIDSALGITFLYGAGFVRGFDGKMATTEDASNDDFKSGYEDGQAAARAVFGE